MGRTSRHRCLNCKLSAAVGGGASRGFVAATQTVWCPSCRILRDVQVGEYGGAELVRDIEPRCPRCHGSDVKPWSLGDACPRCGGEVVATDEDEVQWD